MIYNRQHLKATTKKATPTSFDLFSGFPLFGNISAIAQNSFGGNTETDLELKEDGTMTKPLLDHVRILNDSKYRLDLLSKAIAEYVKEKYAL